MLFVCYEKCSTCARAKKFLDDHKLEYEFRSIKTANPSKEELKKWFELSGKESLKAFFNTSGLLYRSLALKDKLATMSAEEMYELLSSDGMLVKRPLLVTNDKVLVGFKESEWLSELL